ncbi:hypothetical protein MTR67_025748 [Solanum verrucosum]|uniref:Reverse transcriptase RNase H-like domain-containing protein n=1 Tax=Solanum verrucosum TaxID=315347 RepID=A0AAF0TZH7_SOLVR|nr:hypothetical protein MTR67_025748 [Solanum verrucosum]
MNFLGHIFSRKGIEVDPKNTDAVKSWARPLSPSDIRSFLGLASYYRRFVKKCEKNFQELKDILTSTPVLNLPEGYDGLVVYCDVARIELGYVLMHNGKIIQVFSLKIWRHYLYGVHVDVFIGHKSLQYLFKKKDLHFHQHRWLELFKDIDMSVLYPPSKVNVVVDTLSQLFMNSVAHVEDGKNELVHNIHILVRLGIHLVDSSEGSVVVHNGS